MTEGVASHELVYEGGQAVDYRILEVNPAFEAQTGLSAGAVQGSLASEVYGTGEAPFLAEYARVAESGHAVSFETFFAPLGRQFRIGVIRPAPGRFATIFEDVTERRQALEALRASEDRFATVFEKSPFALALSKMPEATLVAVNSAFEALFGFDRNELLGKTSPDLGIADAASQAQLREKLAQCGYCHDFVCMRPSCQHDVRRS
jgi:PAS domain-containing protein